ncbi:type III secretion system translocator chaperone SicA [Pseudomonas carnis]|uniref:type III secretion system translocator chaperone SicA n=1 Tax=Pseudomonas TaxID=286 RepID=UPI000F563CCB|nr:MULTISPECIES: type III secretion system translocator chaperone SicA [Pseudomonas]AZC90109.1 Chaperone protein SicA [Pseudomonas chlororaphis subsp. piscium]MBY8955294.1 type III secretion system translocator chaperone SicA [Pseudomonas carnis]
MSRREQREQEEDRVAQEVMQATLDGTPLKDLRGVSNEQMDSLYAFAHDFYEQGRLDDAEKFFHFLCIYDFYNAQYWMGLAAVHQLKQNYQKAVDLYAVAFAQGKQDYRPMLYTGQCQLALGKAGKAKLCFEYVIEHVQELGMREQAQAYLDALINVEADHSEETL